MQNKSNKCSKARAIKSGFTLIEVLIVVLIIGILAAIALPQYRKSVEKATMAEAVILVKQIAQAHQRYYLATGRILHGEDIEALDIEIKGAKNSDNYIKTKNFLYGINFVYNNDAFAVAQRIPMGQRYYIYIPVAYPERIACAYYTTTSDIEKKLCTEINTKGSL